MADVATRLRDFHLTISAITAIAKKNIFETVPASGFSPPYVTYRVQAGENADVLGGSVGDDPMFFNVDIECVADRQTDATALAAAVRAATHRYRGALSDATAKGCFCEPATIDHERDGSGANTGRFIATVSTRVFL